MQDTLSKSASVAAELKDARLFREACYVDGQWIRANSGQTISVDNPATREIIGRVPKLNGPETRHAIEAANNAFPASDCIGINSKGGSIRCRLKNRTHPEQTWQIPSKTITRAPGSGRCIGGAEHGRKECRGRHAASI